MPQPDTLALVDFAENGPARRSRRDFLTGVAGRRTSGDAYWIRVHRRARACRFEVTLASQDAVWVPVAREALNDVEPLEDGPSVIREGSGDALDRVGVGLRAAGVAHALLSAGRRTLLAVGGRHAGWYVEIVSARRVKENADRPLARVWLRDAALGTSGSGEQFVIADGTRYARVIDSGPARPAAGVSSASVIAPSAAVADALATAFLAGGVELAEHYCAEHAGVMAIVTPDGSDVPLVFGQVAGAIVQAAQKIRVASAFRRRGRPGYLPEGGNDTDAKASHTRKLHRGASHTLIDMPIKQKARLTT